MTYKKQIIVGFCLASCLATSLNSFSQDANATAGKMKESKIVADGATPRLISKQFSFTEGPTVDKNGNIYFTDQPNDKIWKYDTDGKLSVFMDKAGRSNGMYFDKKGNLVSCADERNELWSIDPEKNVTVLLSGYNGQLFNGPNDLWIHPKGGIYFTDPLYKRPYWTGKGDRIPVEKVYYLPATAKQPIAVDSTIKKPNGIIGSADGKTLYVADIGASRIYKYNIRKDGMLDNREVFADMGADGMTTDKKGNIYLAGNGVTVYNKKGEKIEHIAIPEKWSANVCIGGKNRDELFITASQGVYLVPLKVKGVASK
jgi:gluconolactonase